MQDDDRKRATASKVRRVLTILLLAVFIFAAVMLVLKFADERKNRQEIDEALSVAGLTEPVDVPVQNDDAASAGASESSESSEVTEEEPSPLADIDLAALRAVSEDVIGWIIIPDTEISYPLMLGEDNSFYLKHTWQGASNSAGSIFLDYRCSPDFTDFHTIVYGHRMRNNTMFGALKYYSDSSYWQAHPSVYIVTDDAVLRYDIFAAWEAPVDGGVYDLNFPTDAERTDLLDTALSNSAIATGIVPTIEDHILTLSTCTGLGHSSRWIVQAVLVPEA